MQDIYDWSESTDAIVWSSRRQRSETEELKSFHLFGGPNTFRTRYMNFDEKYILFSLFQKTLKSKRRTLRQVKHLVRFTVQNWSTLFLEFTLLWQFKNAIRNCIKAFSLFKKSKYKLIIQKSQSCSFKCLSKRERAISANFFSINNWLTSENGLQQ